MKQQRLKLELQFARERTTLLSKADSLFRIQLTLPNENRRMKTAIEFDESIMRYLGRQSGRPMLRYGKFQECLDKLVEF